MCKVNFATELRDAYSKAVKETFAENENTIDPKAYGKAAIKAVKGILLSVSTKGLRMRRKSLKLKY